VASRETRHQSPPLVIVFIDGVTKDRIIGFEELGNADDFVTSALEMRLKVSGVISSGAPQVPLRSLFATRDDDDDDVPRKSKIRNSARDEDDDDEFDL